MLRTLVVFVVAICGATALCAQSDEQAKTVAGVYLCEGNNPDGSPYVGLVEISAVKGTYLDPGLPPPYQSRDPRRRAGTPAISDRESDVLRMMAVGHSNKEIAAALSISIKTVEAHKANAMRKLQLAGRTDVVRYAVVHGWLRDP